MSKVYSKRSRKSKLTCRDEIEENMTYFQKSSMSVPSAMPKPYDDYEDLIDSKKKPKEFKPPEFSVTVAVEEFDEDSSDLVIVETNEQAPIEVISSDSEVDDTIGEKYTKSKLSKNEIESPERLQGEIVLDRYAILDATNEILENQENIADKILGIEVRNCIGQYRTSFVDKFEAIMQSVFRKWFKWQKSIRTKFRSSPLFYKCYICRKSWWYYNDFREHLKGHDGFKLDLEEYTVHEANIIAYYSGDNIKEADFYTEGDCPKCGYDFEAHKSSTRKDSTYICKIDCCKRIFYTCFSLKTHEYVFHAGSNLSGDMLEDGKQMFCEACSFVFNSQQSYQSHMNLMHMVRSDLVVPLSLKKCLLCNGKLLLGVYHVCTEKKIKIRCTMCYRSFQRNCQYKTHMASQNGQYKCRICDEVLPKRCLEAEHLMKHTDKFVIVKKCLICEEFTVFLDYQTAFDHVSVHLKMRYEGSNYKYISKILIPKSCLQHLEPKLEIKEEPNDVIIAPESNMKQDSDDYESDAGDEIKVQIKDEIDIQEDFEVAHLKQELEQKAETTADISKIFGIKIEPNEMKQDLQADEESEYEDDIIKLDFNFLNTMQEAVEYSTQDCIIKVEGNIEGTQEATDEMQEDEDTQDYEEHQDAAADILGGNVNGKRKRPKIYQCRRCGFHATHREFRVHMNSHCTEKVHETKAYKCTKCSIKFDKFNKFVDHFTEHNLSPLACPECFKTFKSYEAIEIHIEKHIKMTYVAVQKASGSKKKMNEIYYKCKICEESIEKVDFFQHWVGHLTFIEKTEDVPKDSDVLDSSRINQEMLSELLNRLQSPLAVFNLRRGCLICVRHFERKRDYKRHLIEHLLSHAYSMHYLYKNLNCQICGQGFLRPDDYKKHMRDHGDLRDIKCEICDKFFSDSSNYTKHIKVHNKNAYTCDICKKKFQAKFSLEKHIVIHDNQKPIFCMQCNKKFYLESVYKKHVKAVHSKEGQTYACNICKQRFRKLKDKWDHLWYVHRERSKKIDCPKCSDSFRKFSDLKIHMKVKHLIHITNAKMFQKQRKMNNFVTQGVDKKEEYVRLYI